MAYVEGVEATKVEDCKFLYVSVVEKVEAGPYLVSDAAEFTFYEHWSAGGFRWVFKPNMEPVLHVPGESGAGFVCPAAHGYYVVPFLLQVYGNIFWGVGRNVNSGLHHGFNCLGIYLGSWSGTCGVHLNIAAE